MRSVSRTLLILSVCTAVSALAPSASAAKTPAALESDWLFQADNRPSFARAKQEIAWARELAARIARQDGAPDLKKELAELSALEKTLRADKEAKDSAKALYLAVRQVKRSITFKNPAVDFPGVLLIDNPYPGGGEWPHEARHRNGFMGRNGGRLLIVNGLNPDSPVTDLVKTDTPGSFWRPDLSFDARKVVFSMKPPKEMAFHLYEVNVDGSGLKQLTRGDYDDLDPIYLPDGLTKVTADLAWPEVGNGPVDPKETDKYHRSGRYSAYKTPYPISKEDFLVSAKSGRGLFALYLMDLYGNRELIYRGKHNAYHATPFKPRKAPASPPDLVAWPGTGKNHKPAKNGVLFSNNVFEGAPDIPRDKVKYLRVIEMDHKTYSTWRKTVQHDGPAVGVFQAESVKRVLGTAPVESDGSVAFEVPPGRAIYLQLIDKDYRCIQTMRSFTGVMPGETRGCLGCHELKRSASQPGRGGPQRSIATRKGPAKLTPPPWGNVETVGYERFVQPILDKYCAKCHMGKGKAVKKLDMTFRPSKHRWRARVGHRPKDPSPFNEPYYTLVGGACGWGRGRKKDADGVPMSLAGCLIVEGYDTRDPNSLKTLKPMTIYSYKSKLLANATSGKHNKVKIDPLSRRRLTAWIDCNGPYLGREEIEAMYDPQFGGADSLQIRPRTATAPKINRFNVRQDGDSMAIGGPLKLAPPDVVRRVPSSGGKAPGPAKTITYATIVKATYGVGKRQKDVTATLKRLTGGKGSLRISKYNGRFGDPAGGTVKNLVIVYMVGGKQQTVTLVENTPITLKKTGK